jgi:hypothetical protein
MSKNLYLVQYENQNHYDDTSNTLDKTYLDEDLFNKLNGYMERKDIFESKDSFDKVEVNYIRNTEIINVINNILLPECVRKSEDIDKNILDKDIESKILIFGSLANVLRLLVRKRDEFHNNPNILVMVG